MCLGAHVAYVAAKMGKHCSGMNSLVFWGDCQPDKLAPGGQIPCGFCKSIFRWMCWGGGERKCFAPVSSSCQRQAGRQQAGLAGRRVCWYQTPRNQSAFPADTDSWAASRQWTEMGPPNPGSVALHWRGGWDPRWWAVGN